MSSWTTTTFTTHEETPLPASIPRARVLSALHDPATMILRNSRVLSYRLLPPEHKSAHGADVPTYEVTDKMTFLPEAIWPAGSVTYTMSFEKTAEGVKHVLKAAMGMVSRATHTLVEREGGCVLVEEARVEVSRVVAGRVRRNMRETAEGNFRAFVEGLERGVGEGGEEEDEEEKGEREGGKKEGGE